MMRLNTVENKHLLTVMKWFTNEQEFNLWSGPNFRYPFDLESFSEDLNMESLSSFVLVDDEENVLAFGQYYLRLARCHLGRLVVNPSHRGQGLAAQLMTQLLQVGSKALAVSESSLFVFEHNQAAIKSYQSFGFNFTPYPDELPLENCLYMVKTL